MAKKTFKEVINPAMQFISSASEPEATPQEHYKPNPAYIETKSQRVQLLMQPSLNKALTDEALAQGISKNELIHSILKDYIKEKHNNE